MGGSQSIWGGLRGLGSYWGNRTSPRFPCPANATSTGDVETPGTPGVGAGDHNLCFRSQESLADAFHSRHPFFSPNPLFAVLTPIWDPQVPPPSVPHSILGWGVLFYPPLQVLRGQGCSLVSFPAERFSNGVLRAGFALPKLQGLGLEAAGDGESHPCSHTGQEQGGEKATVGNMRSRGTLLARTRGQGDRVWLFHCIFQVLLQHAEQPGKVRDEGLWDVSTEGVGTGAPQSPQQPGMPPALPLSSARAWSCHHSAPVTSPGQLCSCLEHPGASQSIPEQGRDSLPSAPPNRARCPPLRAASGLKYPPNPTIMMVARIQQDIYRSHFPRKGMWTWESPGCCWGEEGLG